MNQAYDGSPSREAQYVPVKLIRIRFTSWRDQSVSPSTLVLEQQLGALITREVALRAAAASGKATRADSEVLQGSLVNIAAELRKIDTERRALLSAERTAAAAETRAATEHRKVGTFGFQVLNAARSEVVNIVDESGNDLPAEALYAYEVVDHNPPLPDWAKEGKVGHFE